MAAPRIVGATTRRSLPPSPLERIALHLGMALIIWGRRRGRAEPDRAELIRRYESQIAYEKRELEYQLRWSITNPRR